MSDPEQHDDRIAKGAVLSDEQGRLYIATGRYYFADRTQMGWHGIGFNGERMSADVPEFMAKNLNAFMRSNTHANAHA